LKDNFKLKKVGSGSNKRINKEDNEEEEEMNSPENTK
jgi:hypothetical protein